MTEALCANRLALGRPTRDIGNDRTTTEPNTRRCDAQQSVPDAANDAGCRAPDGARPAAVRPAGAGGYGRTPPAEGVRWPSQDPDVDRSNVAWTNVGHATWCGSWGGGFGELLATPCCRSRLCDGRLICSVCCRLTSTLELKVSATYRSLRRQAGTAPTTGPEGAADIVDMAARAVTQRRLINVCCSGRMIGSVDLGRGAASAPREFAGRSDPDDRDGAILQTRHGFAAREITQVTPNPRRSAKIQRLGSGGNHRRLVAVARDGDGELSCKPIAPDHSSIGASTHSHRHPLLVTFTCSSTAHFFGYARTSLRQSETPLHPRFAASRRSRISRAVSSALPPRPNAALSRIIPLTMRRHFTSNLWKTTSSTKANASITRGSFQPVGLFGSALSSTTSIHSLDSMFLVIFRCLFVEASCLLVGAGQTPIALRPRSPVVSPAPRSCGVGRKESAP